MVIFLSSQTDKFNSGFLCSRWNNLALINEQDPIFLFFFILFIFAASFPREDIIKREAFETTGYLLIFPFFFSRRIRKVSFMETFPRFAREN